MPCNPWSGLGGFQTRYLRPGRIDRAAQVSDLNTGGASTADVLLGEEFLVFNSQSSCHRDLPNRFLLLCAGKKHVRFIGIICSVALIDLKLHSLSLDQQSPGAVPL